MEKIIQEVIIKKMDSVNEAVITALILWTLLLILIAIWLYSNKEKFNAFFEAWREKKNKQEAMLNAIGTNTKNIELLQSKINDIQSQCCENRKCRNAFEKRIEDSLSVLTASLDELKTDSKRNKRADLRSKISDCYRNIRIRKYSPENPVPYITIMEKTALEGLIQSYENNGGDNSFVHDTVQVEMMKWEIVDNDFEPKRN